MSREKVLVTGGTGFIGGHLARHLMEAGYEVRVLLREKSLGFNRLSGLDVEIVSGDLRMPDSLYKATSKVQKVFYCQDWQLTGHQSVCFTRSTSLAQKTF